jgi:bacterioferritin-associated ferredoxin
MMSRRLVCICNVVTEVEVLKVLKAGSSATADIQRITRAGTSCGRCLTTIDQLVEEFIVQQPEDLQQRIVFDD